MVIPSEVRAFHRAVETWFYAVTFLLSVPSLLLHELAHAVACLPWGGPDALYLILDGSKDGPVSRIPIGAAVYHERDYSWPSDAFVSLAPFVWLAALPFVGTQPSPEGAVALVAVLAGVTTVGDLLKLVSPDAFAEAFGQDEWELRLVIDFSRWTGRDRPPAVYPANDG